MNGGVGELVVELELVHLNSSSFAKCGMVCVDERQCLVYMLVGIVVSVLCVVEKELQPKSCWLFTTLHYPSWGVWCSLMAHIRGLAGDFVVWVVV